MARATDNLGFPLYRQPSATRNARSTNPIADALRAQQQNRAQRERYYDDLLFSEPAAEPEGGSAMRDVGVGLAKGALQLPGAVTGLMDIPVTMATGRPLISEGYDRLGELTRFQPGEWAEQLDQYYSPETQGAQSSIDQAMQAARAEGGQLAGFAAGVAETAKNPRALIPLVSESLPGMIAGAGLARSGIKALGLTTPTQRAVAVGLGEGAVAGGAAMNQAASSSEGADRRDATAALGTVGTTAITGYLGGRLAQRLNLSDPDMVLVNGRPTLPTGVKRKGLIKRVAGGAIAEGVLEELPQGAFETLLSNWADGRPLLENMDRTAVDSIFAGGTMGALFNIPGAREAQPINAGPKTATDAAGRDRGDGFEDITAVPPRKLVDAYTVLSRIARDPDNTSDHALQRAMTGMQNIASELKRRNIDGAIVDETLAETRYSALWEDAEKTRLRYVEALARTPERAPAILEQYRELRQQLVPLEAQYPDIESKAAQRTLSRLLEQHAKDGTALKRATKAGEGEKAEQYRARMAARRDQIDALTAVGAKPDETPTMQAAYVRAETERQKAEEKAAKKAAKEAEKAAKKTASPATAGETADTAPAAEQAAPVDPADPATPAEAITQPLPPGHVDVGLDDAADAVENSPAAVSLRLAAEKGGLTPYESSVLFRKDGRLKGGNESRGARAFMTRLSTLSPYELLKQGEELDATNTSGARGLLYNAYMETGGADRVAALQKTAGRPVSFEMLDALLPELDLTESQERRLRTSLEARAIDDDVKKRELAAAEGVTLDAYKETVNKAQGAVAKAILTLRGVPPDQRRVQEAEVRSQIKELAKQGGVVAAATDNTLESALAGTDEAAVAAAADEAVAAGEAPPAADELVPPGEVQVGAVSSPLAVDPATVEETGAETAQSLFGATTTEDGETVNPGMRVQQGEDPQAQVREGGELLGRMASPDGMMALLNVQLNDEIIQLEERIAEYRENKKAGKTPETGIKTDTDLNTAVDMLREAKAANRAEIKGTIALITKLDDLRAKQKEARRALTKAEMNASTLEQQRAQLQRRPEVQVIWERVLQAAQADGEFGALPQATPTWEQLADNASALRLWIEEVNRIGMDIDARMSDEQISARLFSGVTYVVNQARESNKDSRGRIVYSFPTTTSVTERLTQAVTDVEQSIAATTEEFAERKSRIDKAFAALIKRAGIRDGQTIAEVLPVYENLFAGEHRSKKKRVESKREAEEKIKAAKPEDDAAAKQREEDERRWAAIEEQSLSDEVEDVLEALDGQDPEDVAEQLDSDIVQHSTELYDAQRPDNPHTGASLVSALKRAFGVKALGPRIRVYNSLAEFIEKSPTFADNISPTAQAVTIGEREVAVFADMVPRGREKAILMHEAGVHIGLREVLGQAQYNSIADRIIAAAQSAEENGDAATPFERLALRAQERVINAYVTLQLQTGHTMSEGEMLDETIAYFVEEAVADAEPQARTLIARIVSAVKTWMRRNGWLPQHADVDVNDVLELAYGNAFRNITETAFDSFIHLVDGTTTDEETGVQMSIRAGAMQRAMLSEASPTARRAVEALGKKVRRTLNKFTFTHDIVARYSHLFEGDGLQEWDRLTSRRMQERNLYDERTQRVLTPMQRIMQKNPALADKIHAFELQAQRVGKWAFDPVSAGIQSANKAVDPELRRAFEALPEEAQDIVRSKMALAATMRREMNEAFAADAQTLYDNMLDRLDPGNIERIAEVEAEREKVVKQFMDRAASPLPSYLPVKRFGEYAVVYKSAKLQAAIDADDRKLIATLKESADHYEVQFFESSMAALAARDNARAQRGDAGEVQFFERQTMEQSGEFIPFNLMEGIRARLDAKDTRVGGPLDQKQAASITALTSALNRLYIEALNEESVRKSELKRLNVAGADANMTRGFAQYASSMGATMAAMKVNRDTLGALESLRSEARSSRGDIRDRQMEVLNEVLFRHATMVDPTPNPASQAIMGVTSLFMLLTSPAYYIQNATQPFMLTLDVGIAADIGAIQSTSANSAARLLGDTHQKFVHMVRTVELFNRGVSSAAAYKLARAKGKSKPEAQNYALKVVQSTQGDYSGRNAPSIIARIPGGMGNVMLQFRKFQLIQLSILAKLGHQAFAGASPETRFVGAMQLGYVLATHAAVGGLMGLPAANLIGFVVSNLAGDGDEPDDIELRVRRALDDPDLSDLIMRGLPTMFNMDVSDRLGMGLATSILPFTDVEFTREGGAMMIASLLGPSAALGMQMWDGAGRIMEGHTTLGAAQMLPRGLRDSLRAFHYATKGVTRWNPAGDVALSPDDLSWLDIGMQGLGWPTKTLTDRQQLNRWAYKTNETFDSRSAELRGQYAQSTSAAERAELRAAFLDLQRVRRAYGYTTQSIGNLLDEPAAKAKREREMVGGALSTNENRRFLQSLAE